ncbi:MAG: serine/threonine-protein kinase [Actinomycetota bacterium]
MDPTIGAEFAGHRVEAIIGRGGASVVYLAEHLRLGRKVALKVLAPHLADDGAFRERFIRESRIAAGLDHANIVTVYDAGEVDGSLFISMRYVEGSDLGKVLRDEKVLEPSRAISILSQIADALDTAHAAGLVHRDIKPGNILVDPSSGIPGFERAYLSDFGISKRTTTRDGLTRTGEFVGTVDYVAPEQITGQPIDGRTDVYSLGCVMYECLSGRVPFPGETEVATIYSHLHDQPPSLFEGGGRTAGVDVILARALEKDKEKRYETCSGLVEAARIELRSAGSSSAPTVVRGTRAVGTSPPPAPEAPAEDRVAPPLGRLRRRRRRVASIVVATVSVVVLVALALVVPRDRVDPGGAEGGDATNSPTGPVTPGVDGPEDPDTPRPLALSWSPAYQISSVFGGSGKQAILDAMVTADGVAIAVGHAARGDPVTEELAAVWRSENGRKWDPVLSPSFGEATHQRMIAVTEFGDLLVAAGWSAGDAAIWTSPDQGLTWTRSTLGKFAGGGVQLIRDLGILGSELVAVGSSGARLQDDAAAWVSDDGIEWERMDAPAFAAEGQQEMYAAHVVDDRLFAVGFTSEFGETDGAVWEYADGRWRRAVATSLEEPGFQTMLDVTGGGRLPLIAVGCEDIGDRCDTEFSSASDAAVWTSEDGVVWERLPLAGGRFVGPGPQAMRAATMYRGQVVVVGTQESPDGTDTDGGVWTSIDGVTWGAPGPLSPSASVLGGAGDQSLRALVVFGASRIAMLGFGVTNEGEVEDARIWRATLT